MNNLSILAISNGLVLCTFDITVPFSRAPFELTDVCRTMLRGISIERGDFMFDIHDRHRGNSVGGYLNLQLRGDDNTHQVLSCDGRRWQLIERMYPVRRGAWLDLARIDSATIQHAASDNVLTLHCVDLFYTDSTKPLGVGEPVFK